MRVWRIASVFVLLGTLPLAAQQTAAPPRLSEIDRTLSLTMLANVKADLKDNYYDRTFHGLDLDATFADAAQRVKAASSVGETVAIIADVLLRLNDSHTIFLPPDRKTRVQYGWRASMIGDEPYVTGVTAGSDAEKKGLAPGDRILFWNRLQPTRQNLWQIYYLYNVIRPQSLQRIVVRKPDGSEKVVDIESTLVRRPPMHVFDLLDELASAEAADADRAASVGDIFVWQCRRFGDPKAVERAMKMARKSASLVLDLRNNPGGNVEAMRELASRLFDRHVRVGIETTRKGPKPVDVTGRKDAFAGPIVVLVDSASASASEVTARLVQIEKRGAVIGDRTAGAVMTSQAFLHTLGMNEVAFYATAVTVGDLRMTDGGSLEHTGVTPDEIVLPTGADLAARRDPALARAIASLGGTITPEQAGKLLK